MTIERLCVEDVRCLNGVDIELDPEVNYFYGVNGAGKTSLLEGIFLLGRGRSFRTRQTSRLVRHGASGLTVHGTVGGPLGSRPLGIGFSAQGLEVRVDGRAGEGLASLARALPVDVIDPRLHQLIEAGPSERRRFIDAAVFHVEQTYLQRWRTYRRVLGQRNAALKTGRGGTELEVWTEPLVEAGQAVHDSRARYVEGLAARVQALGRRLLNAEIRLEYRPGWRKGLSLAEALVESLDRDRATGYSQVGPHRADLRIHFAAAEVRDAASRGQQKLVAASLVIGQVELLEALTGQRGTLLVDDPAAELDSTSLERLLLEIRGLKAQLVMTGLALDALAPRAGHPVFHVEQGKVSPVL